MYCQWSGIWKAWEVVRSKGGDLVTGVLPSSLPPEGVNDGPREVGPAGFSSLPPGPRSCGRGWLRGGSPAEEARSDREQQTPGGTSRLLPLHPPKHTRQR